MEGALEAVFPGEGDVDRSAVWRALEGTTRTGEKGREDGMALTPGVRAVDA